LDDDVIGGEEGTSNRQAKQLTERTAYLKHGLEQETSDRITQGNTLSGRINQAEEKIEENTVTISFLKGRGGYLTAYDFETDTPAQEDITEYALTQITNIEDPLEIWDGTRVKNLYNNHVWILNNTQDSEPPVFEWCDNGSDSIDVANNDGLLGLVTGEEENPDGSTDGSITIQSTGKMKLIGFEKLQKRIVGEKREFFVDLDEWELAVNRLLKLEYQLIEIDLYPELCTRKYCGDANNNTAASWYKCDHLGNRTVTGLYMRVEDARGLFTRAAGANSIRVAANNAPYDGGDIGSYQQDKMQIPDTRINMRKSYTNSASFDIVSTDGMFTYKSFSNGAYMVGLTDVSGDSTDITIAPIIRRGIETKPASLSALYCISY
jgi:hypothetical protein